MRHPFGLEFGHKRPIRVHRLEILALGGRQETHQRAEHARLWRSSRLEAQRQPGGIQARQPTGRSTLEVAFRASQYARREQPGLITELQRRPEQLRGAEVRVAVHHAVTGNLGVLEAGNQTHDLELIAPFQAGLEADQAPESALAVLLTQLRHRVRLAARARVRQAFGFERPEARGVHAATRNLLDRHAALEKLEFLPIVRCVRTCPLERGVKAQILVAVEWAIEVIGLLTVTAHAVSDGRVDAFKLDHRCSRIVKRQVIAAGKTFQILGERI